MIKKNKWVYFYQVLNVAEFCQLLLKRCSGSFGTVRSDRSFVLYQFLEYCFKNKLTLKRENQSLLVFHVVNGRQLNFALRKFTSDPWVYRQVIIKEEHDFIRQEIAKRKLPMEYMLDAGANIGLTSAYFKAHFPGLHIAAIEPDETNLTQCKKNIELNRFNDVTFIPKALWYKTTSLKKDDDVSQLEWGYRFKEKMFIEEGDHLYEAITIDDCLLQLGWTRIDYLKIDIEGAEQFLFESDDYCQFLYHTNVISIEAHTKETENAIHQMLTKSGFDVYKTGELIVGIKSL